MRNLDDPFTIGAALVEELRKTTPCILVDMHCETTSREERDGQLARRQVSAVIGSHTHVRPPTSGFCPGHAFSPTPAVRPARLR